MFENKRILITGGSGTLGKAILRVAERDNWGAEFTIFSRDPLKQQQMKNLYPNARYVIGDVTDGMAVDHVIAGHDIVIHCAAVKHVVEAEFYPLLAYQVNVIGSMNVLEACLHHSVETVVGISTDKAAHPTNTYGATKMQMERLFQYYATLESDTRFVLTRYGNVFGSNGSFIHNWKRDYQELGYVRSTDPEMTRFWLHEDDAVELVKDCLNPVGLVNGTILIPLAKALSIGEIEDLLIPTGTDIVRIPVRPGEKTHETLITQEETWHAVQYQDIENKVFISPRYLGQLSYQWRFKTQYSATPFFDSKNATKLTDEEFYQMVGMESIAE